MRKIFTLMAIISMVMTVNAADALSGKFTINPEGGQVVFSKGNLQASTTDLGENWTWGFATNQWDYVGDATANNAIIDSAFVSVNDTVDLFGWSTAATYYGIHNSEEAEDYTGDFVDWGATMGDGWRTLKTDEWVYLFYGRTDAAHLFGMGSIDEVCGIILLPDNWTGAKFTDTDNGLIDQGNQYFNHSSTNFSFHPYTAGEWDAMETAGAVFLPAAGIRTGMNVSSVNSHGFYWSSSRQDYRVAYMLTFDSQSVNPQRNFMRHYGLSVRLVQDCAETGIEEVLNQQSKIKNQKFMVDGQLFILRDNHLFNAQGARVK